MNCNYLFNIRILFSNTMMFTYILNINNAEIVLHVSYIIVEYFYKLKSDKKKSTSSNLYKLFLLKQYLIHTVISFSYNFDK